MMRENYFHTIRLNHLYVQPVVFMFIRNEKNPQYKAKCK